MSSNTALVSLIESQKSQFEKVSCSAPGIQFESEKGFALQILGGNDYLARVAMSNQDSLKNAITNVSAIGISLNPASKLAYLVPRKGAVCLDISYMGLMHIAQQSGAIKWGQAVIVREKDVFELQPVGQAPIHKYDPFDENRGKIIGCYVVVKTDTDDFLTTPIPIGKIYAVRDRSEAWKSYMKDKTKLCPWVTDEEEMIKKGLSLDTPIPTPQGWTTMGDVKSGDKVFDMHGSIVSVKATSEVKRLKCFKIKFQNGEEIICDDEHRWVARAGDRNAHRKEYSVLTVNEMYDAKAKGLSVTLPVQGALDTPDVELPIDPYLLGFWLGDGSQDRASITCGERDLDYLTSVISNSRYELGSVHKDSRSNCYSVGIIKGFREDLSAAGLLGNKHVPQIYLRASLSQRKQLLAGLFDSDGHISKARGKAIFYNKNELIAEAVHELAASIGEVPTLKARKVRGFGIESTSYAVEWYPAYCPCLMDRKAENFIPKKIARYRTVASIEIVDTVPTRCIAVTGESETFLAGRCMTPTHNTVVKNASKMWPKRDRLDKAVHHMNTDGGEGIAFPASPAGQENRGEKNITPASLDQQSDIAVRLHDMGKTFDSLRPYFASKKITAESVQDLTQEEATGVLAFLKKRAA